VLNGVVRRKKPTNANTGKGSAAVVVGEIPELEGKGRGRNGKSI